MSLQPLNRSPDLKKLRQEGYDITVDKGYLLVRQVPFVNSNKQILRGTLVSPLTLAGDVTVPPDNHVAFWIGEIPCDSQGAQMPMINNPNLQQNEKVRQDLGATVSFSSKPQSGQYPDYYEKMTKYIALIENEAKAIDKTVTAKIFPLIPLTEEESVFCYMDNSSSRAGIVTINDKLDRGRVAVVGLGGTGAYILDYVAKTLVKEIHLFDGDPFLQHNAFRSPGAPSLEDLAKKPAKVDWFQGIYSHMRRKIIPHAQFVSEKNLDELRTMDFVFLCIEGTTKKIIVDYLVENRIPFIDVGIGIEIADDMLLGQARVTTVTPESHDHIANRIYYETGEDEYSRNIQIAEMNALNAALAVIKWKKLWGIYVDARHELNSTYKLDSNDLINDDEPNEKKEDQA